MRTSSLYQFQSEYFSLFFFYIANHKNAEKDLVAIIIIKSLNKKLIS